MNDDLGAGATGIAVVIIARNEEAAIGRTIDSLYQQSVFSSDRDFRVYVFANGCTDSTASAASEALKRNSQDFTKFEVHETEIGGKSRSWNRVVHEIVPDDVEFIVFLDADIVFAHRDACKIIIELLEKNESMLAASGRPTKSIAMRKRKSFVDKISLRVSEDGRALGAINGSLYCLRAPVARNIWLPDETSGEDGFLNAMVRTNGFSHGDNPALVGQASETTHYYDAPGIRGLIQHEVRMLMATTINIWIFEHFQSMHSDRSLSPHIRYLNEFEPDWVKKLISYHRERRFWLIRSHLVFRRFPRNSNISIKYLTELPLGIAAVAFTAFVAILANQRLRQAGAAQYW